MRVINKASFIAVVLGTALFGQQAPTAVLKTVYHGVSDSLFNLALRENVRAAGALPFQPTEMVQKHGPLVDNVGSASATINVPVSEAVIQTAASRPAAAVAGASFEGPGQGLPGFTDCCAPPDSTLAVGPAQIVAWVNSSFAIFSKTGTPLLPGNGTVSGNSLFALAGNVCATTNRGDPILQYDRLAQRWILSQFAFNVDVNGNPIAPYLQCVAVSTTNNPLGTFFLYSIVFGSTSPNGFNDYGKLGIWPDAYYTSYNVFGGSPAGGNTGVALCASDRTLMLAGNPAATTLCAPVAFYGGGGGFLPADMDGITLPTDQTQGDIFLRQSTAPALRMLKVKPNFLTSTLTFNDGFGGIPGSFVALSIGTTTRACNGAGGACVAQPGTGTLLDTLGDRVMYRLAYRNRGGIDSLVVNQSVDPDAVGPRSAAVRWYEIRSPFANPPTLFENSTFDPGASGDRWMGSIAQDKMGNMLLGYSIANAGTGLKPSINFTGRLRSDLRNQMQAETRIFTGLGSQTVRSGNIPLSRWGDYTTMQVDPVDDCTFWYINQYIAADGVFNWQTRISSFKFNGCQ